MSSDSHWSGNEILQVGTSDCKEPAVTAVGEVLHAVWTQDKTVFHAYLTGSKWSEPKAVGTGGQASLASTPDGKVHCLFAAEMFGNVEIYAATWDGTQWSLPEVVSHTTGMSMYPTLVVGPDGSLYAAWADTTPGYPTIYYGHRETIGWTSTPIPNGVGNRPTIAVGHTGEVYVAWQTRLTTTKRYEIFCSVLDDGQWSLPDNISDTSERHSIYPQLATNATGACHLIWQENAGETFSIQHSDRRPNGWSQAVDVSQSAGDCHLPHIAANRQGTMQAIWAQGQALQHRVRPPDYDAAWWRPETANDSCGDLSDLAMAISPAGVLHVLWCSYTGTEARRLGHIRREPIFKQTVFVSPIPR